MNNYGTSHVTREKDINEAKNREMLVVLNKLQAPGAVIPIPGEMLKHPSRYEEALYAINQLPALLAERDREIERLQNLLEQWEQNTIMVCKDLLGERHIR